MQLRRDFNRSALLGLAMMLPTLLFFFMVASKYLLGLNFFFSAFERGMADPETKEMINIVTPVIFLGGSLLALLVNFWSMAKLKFQKLESDWISSLVLKPNLWNLGLVIVSLLLILTMLGYWAVENYGTRPI